MRLSEDSLYWADCSAVRPEYVGLRCLLIDGWTTPMDNGTACFLPAPEDKRNGRWGDQVSVVCMGDGELHFVGRCSPHKELDTLCGIIMRRLTNGYRNDPDFRLWEAVCNQSEMLEHRHSTLFGVAAVKNVLPLARAFCSVCGVAP